jgi:PHD/YefM family antitoxin component YafN of YafNO toxin-antitoxin module
MPDSVSTAAGSLADLVQTKWSSKFDLNLNDRIVFNSIVRRDYEGDLSMGGTVKIPSLADVTATNLTEGAANSAVSVTASTVPLVVNRRAAVDFVITDQAQLQSVAFMDKAEEIALAAIAREIQDYIISIFIPSASAPDHQIAFDSGTTLQDADLLEALDLEKAADWPESGLYMVTGGAQFNDLLNVSKFYTRDLSGGPADIVSGAVLAPIYGHQVAWSSAVGNKALLWHESGLQMVIQKGVNVNFYDMGAQGQRATRMTVDVLYGAVVVDDERLISIG